MSEQSSVKLNPLNQLVIKIAESQDRVAFKELFESVSPKLKSYAMQCGSSAHEAEELIQECFITVWRKAHTFNPNAASAITWLYTIVRNKRIDLLRKTKNKEFVISDDLWPEPETGCLENDVESDLNQNIARTLLHGLSQEQRQIVYKVYFEGKSHSEIASDLGEPLGTIKSRLRLAMKKLDSLAKENITWLIIILVTTY